MATPFLLRVLPTVVDIMVIWVRFPNPVHFISLISKMSMFTLAISCLTTSTLPCFMDLTFQVPMQYCSLKHWTLLPSPVTSTSGFGFALALSLYSLWNYFSTVLSSILGTYWPGKSIFQCPIFLPFHTVHGVLKAIILKWFAIPFSMSVGMHTSFQIVFSFLWKNTQNWNCWTIWLVLFLIFEETPYCFP